MQVMSVLLGKCLSSCLSRPGRAGRLGQGQRRAAQEFRKKKEGKSKRPPPSIARGIDIGTRGTRPAGDRRPDTRRSGKVHGGGALVVPSGGRSDACRGAASNERMRSEE